LISEINFKKGLKHKVGMGFNANVKCLLGTVKL